jgi:predicted amino acid racemase
MVEMGDLREGIMPEDLEKFVQKILYIPGIRLKGIGANFGCLNKVPPNNKDMLLFSNLVNKIKIKFSHHLKIISGGNSASIAWALSDNKMRQINELRLGEAILLGIDPISGNHIEGLYTDAFTLISEVIETKKGLALKSIFSQKLNEKYFKKENQIILALGKQDTDITGLTYPKNTTFVGATSDHLVLKVSSSKILIGSELKFQLDYNALMRVMNSPTVEKITYKTN